MITKEQAMTCTRFKQIAAYYDFIIKYDSNLRPYKFYNPNKTAPVDINWRANGKCKTWKRSPERFQLPIKHGLYNYSYITEENTHLFEVIE